MSCGTTLCLLIIRYCFSVNLSKQPEWPMEKMSIMLLKQLEFSLFRSSPTLEAYLDKSTLISRLSLLAYIGFTNEADWSFQEGLLPDAQSLTRSFALSEADDATYREEGGHVQDCKRRKLSLSDK